jgi:Xaa-Pro aminopeptidase
MMKLTANDVVLIDCGFEINSFQSDCTRMYFVGEPNPKQLEIYNLVKRAKDQATLAARTGLCADKLDVIARNVISEAGFGELFVHSLGHGLGMEVHESPRISDNSKDILEAGMVFTLEPGVYFPGEFGIRLEDVFVLDEIGAKNLSTLGLELMDFIVR